MTVPTTKLTSGLLIDLDRARVSIPAGDRNLGSATHRWVFFSHLAQHADESFTTEELVGIIWQKKDKEKKSRKPDRHDIAQMRSVLNFVLGGEYIIRVPGTDDYKFNARVMRIHRSDANFLRCSAPGSQVDTEAARDIVPTITLFPTVKRRAKEGHLRSSVNRKLPDSIVGVPCWKEWIEYEEEMIPYAEKQGMKLKLQFSHYRGKGSWWSATFALDAQGNDDYPPFDLHQYSTLEIVAQTSNDSDETIHLDAWFQDTTLVSGRRRQSVPVRLAIGRGLLVRECPLDRFWPKRSVQKHNSIADRTSVVEMVLGHRPNSPTQNGMIVIDRIVIR